MHIPYIKHRIVLTCLFLGTVCVRGADSSSPETIVKAYLDATHWEDRLQYVKNPNQVKPFMERQYKNAQLPSAYDPQSIKAKSLAEAPLEWYRVDVNLKNVNGQLFPNIVYVTHTTDGYKIDWEASLGFNPITLVAYRAALRAEPTVFRLIAELDDYYNYDFRDSKDTHYSILLYDYTGQKIHGYIEKRSASGKTLFDFLSDGKPHKVIVKLLYPDAARDASVTNITDIVAYKWYLP
jgi:hypothetical protein